MTHEIRRALAGVSVALLLALTGRHLQAQPTVPVVPGASGFGMTTRAAYGAGTNPTIYRVTSVLDDGGSGTLRAAMEATGPRVVIFERSGTIALNGPIVVTNPYLTVAGQTAPAPGITIRNYGIQTPTHDVLLQHLRVRPGGTTCNTGLETWDGYNIVYDHMSVSWGQAENVVLHNGTVPLNVSIWRSLIAEGLEGAMNFACAGGGVGGVFSSNGVLLYQNAPQVSIIQSLLATNVDRNPYIMGDSQSYIANNLIYNWGNVQAGLLTDPGGVGPTKTTFLGNYFKRGPLTATYAQPPFMVRSSSVTAGSELYLSDNFANGTMTTFGVVSGINPSIGTPPVTVSGYTALAGSAVYSAVLPVVGARPFNRDAVDDRIIAYVQAGNGPSTPVAQPGDVGGYPSLAVNTQALTTPVNPHTVTGTGYTNLEIWLHGLAAAVETAPVGPVITTTTLPNPVLTVAYSRTLAATGGTAPYTWAIASGALPTSLSLNTGTGAITGTPTVAGVFAVTFRVTDNVAATSTTSFSLTAQPAITISTQSALPGGEKTAAYSTTLVAAGDETPYAWVLTAGSLPAGLTLGAATGIISGNTTTATGTASFTVRATGALTSTTTKAMTLTVVTEYRPPNRPVSRNAAEGILFRRSGTPPSNPYDRVMRGDLWSDTSTVPPTIKICIAADAISATWAVLP